jgi:hypothetical protein
MDRINPGVRLERATSCLQRRREVGQRANFAALDVGAE